MIVFVWKTKLLANLITLWLSLWMFELWICYSHVRVCIWEQHIGIYTISSGSKPWPLLGDVLQYLKYQPGHWIHNYGILMQKAWITSLTKHHTSIIRVSPNTPCKVEKDIWCIRHGWFRGCCHIKFKARMPFVLLFYINMVGPLVSPITLFNYRYSEPHQLDLNHATSFHNMH